jgi:protocatechuate 3,4-dioxygenase beta subunit
VRGRVVDPRGAPVGGARVWATTSDFWARLPLDLEKEALPEDWIQVRETQCDAEGRFAFEDLKPGPLRLAARAAGFAPAYREGARVAAREMLQVPDLALAPGVVLEGTVLGADGQPRAGARLLLSPACALRGQGSVIQVPGSGVPAGESGADGRFQIDELAPGPFELVALAPDCPPAVLTGETQRAGEHLSGLVVRFDPGAGISGTVRLAGPRSEGGLAGRTLRVEARAAPEREQHAPGEDREQPEPTPEARLRSAEVDAEGRFAIEGLRPGASYLLVVGERRGERWRPAGAPKSQTARAPVEGVELELAPDAALVLRALDAASGAPVEELVVLAGLGRARAVRSDDGKVQKRWPDGRVRAGDLRVNERSKPAELRLLAPGYKEHVTKDLRLSAGEERDLGEIRLVPERVVNVRVLAPDGAPVAGARVLLSAGALEALENLSRSDPEHEPWGQKDLEIARTDGEGRARLTSRPGASVAIQASAPGHLASAAVVVALPRDADHALELALRRGGTVRVRVLDAAGRPVAGAAVAHRLPIAPGAEEPEEAGSCASDAEGLARFEALAPGVHGFRLAPEESQLESWNESGEQNQPPEAAWQELVVAEAGEQVLDLLAPSRGSLFGRVREGGSPLAEAVVKLVPYVEGEEQGWTWSGGAQDPTSCETGPDGRYRIENRPCGEYRVLVSHAARRMPAEFRVALAPGEQQLELDLDLNGIEGRALDEQGMPLAGVEISVDHAEGGIEMPPPYSMVLVTDARGRPDLQWRERGRRQVRTDAQGRYELRGLAEGRPLVVTASGEEVEQLGSPPLTLAPGELRSGVDFTLRRAGRLELTLAVPAGDERWYRVELVRPREGGEDVVRQVWLATWDRRQRVGSLGAGRYVVRLSAQQGPALAETEVQIEIGALAHVALTVP